MRKLTLGDVGREMVALLRDRPGRLDARCRRGTVSWLLEAGGWMTPVWVAVTHYSGNERVIRWRNDMVRKLPRSQWVYGLPKVWSFELTALATEVEPDLLLAVIRHAEAARKSPLDPCCKALERFSAPGGHYGYAWTPRAREYVRGGGAR